MRVIARKESGLTEIKTAIYYKSPVMPLGVENLYQEHDPNRNYAMLGSDPNVVSQGVYYNSGELGCDFRFFEYGLEYFFESGNPLESLGKDIEDLLTKNGDEFLGPRDLKDLGKYIIPTNLPDDAQPGEIKYFGSFRTSSQEVYAFYTPAGISKIELYDVVLPPDQRYYDYDYGWELGIRPKISLYLGVSQEGRVPRAWKDTDFILGPTPETDLDSLGKLQDERDCAKMVFLVLEQKSRYGALEISTTAWTKLLEPLRNKPEAHLHSLSDIPEQTTETIQGLIFDGASGSILGRHQENLVAPILQKKLGRIDPLEWNAWRRYRFGQEATYLGETWVSLADENFGENPKASKRWAKKEKMTNFFTTWFNILCREGKIYLLGSESESKKINVPRYAKESVFRLTPDLGYIPADPEVIVRENPGIDLNVVYTENLNPNETMYYMFYLMWSENKPEPGSTIVIPMECRKICPKLYIPYFLAQESDALSWFDYSNTKEIDLAMERGQYFTIGEEFSISLGNAISSITDDPIEHNTLIRNLPLLKFYVEKQADQENTQDPVTTSVWNPDTSEVEVTLSDKVDYEKCSYYLKVAWDYKKITVSNSGDYAIEYPVADIIRTKTFRTKIKPMIPDQTPKFLRMKCGAGEWFEVPYDGSQAIWTSGNGENNVTLSVSNDPDLPDGYILQVSNVTEDLIIDIKVV